MSQKHLHLSLFRVLPVLTLGFLTAGAGSAFAGVFNLTRFVEPSKFAIGLEPEVTLTDGAGIAVQAKYTHGLNELTNVQFTVGSGGGPRGFRVGAGLVFDFFPDTGNQPGIGLAVQGMFVDAPLRNFFEAKAMPYLHKAFASGSFEFDPFVSMPIGMAFTNSRYDVQAALAIGSMFKANENLRYTVEFGIAIQNTDSYVSGGLTYYH